MKFLEPLKTRFAAVAGGAMALAAIFADDPAQAQTVVSCPPGYAFYGGAGCVPAAPGYAAIYGSPVVTVPPVYDTYGLAYGYGHPVHHGHHGHDEHFHGHDDHHR